ncbi:unnamed protein product [Echinostoma caproni]|uniref:Gamma-tubulin complex component n=1 Tax=Echinostoma caproni TaxID=27848 RepID=A0A183AYW3_9TREM|nr:unnamed protein product [Echinostoma caproni]
MSDRTVLSQSHSFQPYLSSSQKDAILQSSLPRTNALLMEVASLLPEWTADLLFQIDKWDRFSDRVRENVNPLCSDEQVETLVQHLQYTGNITVIESPSGENMIALNPQWLGTEIVGRMFKIEALHNVRITGSYTIDDLQLFVRVVNTVNLVALLEALGVLVCCVVQEESVTGQPKKRRSRRNHNSTESDFFDQASQRSSSAPQTPPTKRNVSVHLTMDLVRMSDQVSRDDIQLELPRYTLIPMHLPGWEHESDPNTTRYLGFQLTTERGQMVHLIPRIQVHLRYIVADLFNKGRWNRSGEECKPSFTRWEMHQVMNGLRITIFEGAVEVTVALNELGQAIHLLARSALKHVRKTFSLVHQLVTEICDHIHSICPSLLIRGGPLYASDLEGHLELPTAWDSEPLISTFWHLYQKVKTPSQAQTAQLPETVDQEKQLIQDLFFGDERLMQDAMSCYQLPLSSLRFPVVHMLAREIDCHSHGENKLIEFITALGVSDDPEEFLTVFRRGHFSPHAPSFFESLIHAEQIQSTANMETLTNALRVFQRFDLIECTYHSHLLLRLFTRRNTEK